MNSFLQGSNTNGELHHMMQDFNNNEGTLGFRFEIKLLLTTLCITYMWNAPCPDRMLHVLTYRDDMNVSGSVFTCSFS